MAKSQPPKFERPFLIFAHDERKRIVDEVQSGQLTFREALSKYNIINKNTLRSWLLKYGNDPKSILAQKLTNADRRRAAYRVIYQEATPAEVAAEMGVGLFSVWGWVRKYRNETPIENPIIQSVEKSVRQTEVDDLKLKVAALEMMIDVAEKELNIDIRKKSGTKR